MTRRPPVAVVLAALAVLCAAPRVATAAALSWNILVNGNAGTAANWSPSQVPAAGDLLTFAKNVGIQVTFDSTTVPTVQSLTYRAGTISHVLNPSLAANGVTVGLQTPDVATANLTSGTLRLTSSLLVGNNGGTGTFGVASGSSLVSFTGASAIAQIGGGGPGTLNVTGGGRITGVTSALIIASQPNIAGTVNVSGFSLSPAHRSSLFTSGSAPLTVGSQGPGTLNVTGGAAVSASLDAFVGRFVGGTGNVLVDGTGNNSASLLGVSHDLDLGLSGLSGTPAGTGTLQISNGGLVQVSGTTRVGNPAGAGTGTLRMRPGGTLNTNGLNMVPGQATLDFNGGTIDVKFNPFTPPTSALDLDSASPEALTLESGASCTLSSPSVNGYSLVIGDAHGATVFLTNSGHLTTNAQVAVGLSPGASGMLVVEKSAQMTNNGQSNLTLGLGGAATLNMFLGSQLTQSVVNLAFLSGSSAFAHVSGLTTSLTADSIWVGGSSSGKGGTAMLLVDASGGVQTTGNLNQFLVYSGDSVVANTNGSINVPNLFTNNGHVVLGDGIVTAGVFTMNSGGTLAGAGTVSSIVNAAAGSTIAPSGGTLVLGTDGAPNGFIGNGTVSVGSAGLTVHSGTPAALGTVTIDLGTLGSSNGVKIAAGKTLSGRGTINGAFTNQGTVTATTDGLTFTGLLTNAGGTFAGSQLAFTGTGGFTGAGSLPVTTLTGDATTTVTATGPLTLGAGTMGASTALHGRLVCGANTVTFPVPGTVGIALGAATTLSGGTLQCTAGFVVPANDTLEGNGTVGGSVTSQGIVAPGFSAGTLSFTGSFTQFASGKLTLEIGRLAADPHDQLNLGGALQASGALDLRLLPGTVPQPGQVFTLVTYASHIGLFNPVTINGQPAGSQVTVAYGANALTVTINAITVGVPADPASGITAVALTGQSGARALAAFELALPAAAHVDLAVFDATGRRVAQLVHGDLAAGRTRYPLRAAPRALSPGVYFARAIVRGTPSPVTRTARAVLTR